MKTINASNVRKSFARILESIEDQKEVVVIMRYRDPIAAIVPISRLDQNERKALERKRAKPHRQ